jgi:hypothetical protein
MSIGISMHVNELSFCANMGMGAFDNRTIAPYQHLGLDVANLVVFFPKKMAQTNP